MSSHRMSAFLENAGVVGHPAADWTLPFNDGQHLGPPAIPRRTSLLWLQSDGATDAPPAPGLPQPVRPLIRRSCANREEGLRSRTAPATHGQRDPAPVLG